MWRLLLQIMACLCSLPCLAQEWRTEGEFAGAIGRALIATHDIPAPLKPYLQRLSREREVAILLDRRIDPSRLVRVNLQAATFDQGIRELAQQAESQVTIVGDTLYVSPEPTANKLRTLIWLKKVELEKLVGAGAQREFELVRRKRFAWDDLAEPRLLVMDIAREYGLTPSGLELIPHDLWGAGNIAHGNAAELLQLVLGQFDLSFEWTDEGRGIQIMPAPEAVTIRKEYVVPLKLRESILVMLEADVPGANAVLAGAKLAVDATLEDHDLVAAILKGKVPVERELPENVALAKKRFTLEMERKPAGSLLKTLEVQGIEVRYDREQLKQAGIDLRQLITMSVRRATIEELLQSLCDQVPGLAFRIAGETVHIEPAAQ